MKIELETMPDGTSRIKTAIVRGQRIELARRAPMGASPATMEAQGNFTRDVAYSKFADLAVKGSAAAMSAAILAQQNSTLGKIIFGTTTAVLGAVSAASAYEALG